MLKNVTVYRILIASPSDVSAERQICKDVMLDWNATNSRNTNVYLEPVLWETHVAATLGNDPQEIINEQLLGDCDFVIGVFWSRIGLPTANAIGGAVEELDYFIKNSSQAIVGFSQAPIPQSALDIDQLSKLKAFKDQCQKIGIVFSYASLEEFKNVLSGQLARQMSRRLTENKSESYSLKKEQGLKSNYNVKDDHDRLLIQAHQNKAFDESAIKIALKRVNNKPIRVLDAGCGFGFVTHALFSEMQNAIVIGVDHSEDAINYASANLKSDNMGFLSSDIYKFIDGVRARGEKFDVVFASQLLHHVDIPESLSGSRYFCESLFWASQPKQAAKT